MLTTLLALSLQTTWYVDAAAAPPGLGTQAAPYSRIEYALDRPTTVDGDTVLVAPGLYTHERVDFLGKAVRVVSSDGPATTVISAPPVGFAPGSAVSFRLSEGRDSVLEGFTVVGVQGRPSSLPGPGLPFVGGGIFCVGGASPTLRDLVIRGGEECIYGGGMFLDAGSPLLERVRFEDCGDTTFLLAGGGLWARSSNVELVDCTFDGCLSGNAGGAVHALNCTVQARGTTFRGGRALFGPGAGLWLVGGGHTLTDCRVEANVSGDRGAGIFAQDCVLQLRDTALTGNDTGVDIYPGGGLYFSAPTSGPSPALTITRCEISGNVGQFGGGAWIGGVGTIRETRFDGNVAAGGQLGCGGGALDAGPSVSVSGCVFTRNVAEDTFSDGGGAVLGSPILDRCTFVDNRASGGASAVEGAASLRNSIVRGGTLPRLDPAITPSYCNIEGGAAGTGNIDLEPRFHRGADDVHLLPGSPGIDVASPSAGNDPDGTRADMGAHPFDPHHCGPGCDGFVGATTCLATPNSTGVGAFLEGLGRTRAADPLLVLNVHSVPRNQFGLFIIADAAISVPLGGGSQGTLCVGGNIIRFNEVVSDRGTGIVSFAPRCDALPGIGAVQAGDTWYFQYWFRDNNPFQTSNTSSALRVDFR